MVVEFSVCGCAREAPAPVAKEVAAPGSVRVVIVDEPLLVSAIQGIAGDWKAQSGSVLQIVPLSSDGASIADKLDADAVLFPPELMGTLAERRSIRPLNAQWLAGDSLEAGDLLTPLASPELCWDAEPFAVPLGEPILLFFYRTDVLARLGKKPPATWEEYQDLADRIGGEHNLRATAEPLAGGWASRLLLARAAAYARHRDYVSVLFNRETMAPLIAGPPFVRALAELVKTAKLNPPGAKELSPQQCAALALSGQTALAIGFLDRRTNASPAISIGVAELPGSDTVYHPGHDRWEPRRSEEDRRVSARPIGGRVGAVVRGGDHAQAAFALLSWLAGRQASEQIMSGDNGFQPFRASQLAAPERWLGESIDPPLAKQYAEAFASAMRRKEVLWLPQIPGAIGYMAALDEAVRAAVSGEKTPEQALAAAAENWRQITLRHGAQKQQDAYRKSLKISAANP